MLTFEAPTLMLINLVITCLTEADSFLSQEECDYFVKMATEEGLQESETVINQPDGQRFVLRDHDGNRKLTVREVPELFMRFRYALSWILNECRYVVRNSCILSVPCDSSVYMYLYGRLVFKIFFNYVVLKSSRHINSVNQLVFTWIDGVTTLSFVYRYRVYLPVQSISLIVYYTQKKLTINQSLCVGFCGSEGMLTSIGDTVVHFYFNYRWNIQFREALTFFWKMKTYWKCKYYERQNPKMFLLPIMKVYHSLQWY